MTEQKNWKATSAEYQLPRTESVSSEMTCITPPDNIEDGRVLK